MANGPGMEVGEIGIVALFGLILTPGMFWIGSAKSGASRVRRIAAVAGFIGVALALEAALDRSAESVVDKIEKLKN